MNVLKALYLAVARTYSSGDEAELQANENGHLKVVQQETNNYIDETNGKAVVENRNTAFAAITAQGSLKTGAGFIHTLHIAPLTATPTAGLLKIRDATADGTGTILYQEWVFATTPGHTIILDTEVETGVYADFDATLANISISGSGR